MNAHSIDSSYATGDVEGANHVGGLIGRNASAAAEVTASHATGDVSGDYGIGGLVGANESHGTISTSYSTGDVEGLGSVGGLVGFSFYEAVIVDSYATSNVKVTEGYGGGLVGWMDALSMVKNSYSAGNVDDDPDSDGAGGLIGILAGDVEDSYWDETTSGQEDGIGNNESAGSGATIEVTGLNTGEFDDPENFQDWDFVETWTIGEAPDGPDRPIFQWQQD